MRWLVCAQHGRSPEGVQVPCVKPNMKRTMKALAEVKEVPGDRASGGRLGKTREPMNTNPLEPERSGDCP
jgi:hypothetical protein